MRRTPLLIVGGGPAGSAAAITLARVGRRPTLVERSTGPHDMVCGGFLGWDALAALRHLGVDAAALGARPIRRLRLVAGDRIVEAPLPFAAAGLSRRTLDAALLDVAAAAGAQVRRGLQARAVDTDARVVRFDDGTIEACDALFLATGKHDLRGARRKFAPRLPALGLRAALPVSARRTQLLDDHIELHLFDGGYAGLLLQEDGTTNLCLSVAPRRLAAAGSPQRLVAEIAGEAPLLGDRMATDIPALWDAIAGVPYGWRARATAPGLFRTGDQGAVIASLAGDGIALALASGRSAAAAALAGGADAAPAWQQAWERQSAPPIRMAEAFRHAAEHRVSRPVAMALLRLFPALATLGAQWTRIGHREDLG